MTHALRNEDFTTELWLAKVFRTIAEIFPVNKDLMFLFPGFKFHNHNPFFFKTMACLKVIWNNFMNC